MKLTVNGEEQHADGPLTLAERFAGRPHSPGRITRAVSRHRSVERRAADRATA